MRNLIKLIDQAEEALKEVPSGPGVYKFLDSNKNIIYIGKAKNLKLRVKSYFPLSSSLTKKVKNLSLESVFLDLILTTTELEALLLEQHLIKEFKPRYNVQFKDDKGYPWIRIGISKDYPFAKSHLGKKESKDLYLGPYPSSYSLRDTLKIIQKIFKLRDCSESFFKNRSRPCMQYEIGRCSAPCVKAISHKEYQEDVKATINLLKGEGNHLLKDLYKNMDKFSKSKSYEKAASYRDRLSSLRAIQRDQSIAGYSRDRDAITLCTYKGKSKIGVTKVRGGWITSHENFIQDKEIINEDLIGAFICSYYFSTNICPNTLVVERAIDDRQEIQRTLSEYHGKKIRIISRPRSKDKGLLEISKSNTDFALRRKKGKKDLTRLFDSLSKILDVKGQLNLIESYDISHHSGGNAVGGCVAFKVEGKAENLCRTYNISSKNSGNDIGSMKEVIQRRFTKNDLNVVPDLVIIDGGKAHISAVRNELDKLNIKGINLLSISKGIRRKSEWDRLHTEEGKECIIQKNSEEYRFLQELRDESHRYTISRQRRKQLRLIKKSSLDPIGNIGEERKKALLRFFGSLDSISKASREDLIQVKGIGEKTANKVFKYLN